MTRKASHDSELDHFRGLHSLRPTFGLVLDLIALVQRLETIGLNNRVVHEHIIPTSIRGNESVTLASAEELHSSLVTFFPLFLCREQTEESSKPHRIPHLATPYHCTVLGDIRTKPTGTRILGRCTVTASARRRRVRRCPTSAARRRCPRSRRCPSRSPHRSHSGTRPRCSRATYRRGWRRRRSCIRPA